MKILIAYDGSGYSHNILHDLLHAGLPDKADVVMISVSEVWLSPKRVQTSYGTLIDKDTVEYFQKHSEQMARNLAKTKEILVEAKGELEGYFPKWNIDTESTAGSPAQAILQKAAEIVPNLIVVGSRGLSSDRGSGLGSVSQQVLSDSHFPVRIVRRSPGTDAKGLKISICFDNSSCSLEAVKTAASRNWQGKAEFSLLVVTDQLVALIPGRVLRVIPGIPEGQMKGEEKSVEFLTENALRILENAGFTTSVHIYSGNPRIMLVDKSKEWKADTIFIGRNSRRSHSLGCVASAVAARSSCSVEVIQE